ncbi:MAG: hypothetical protein FDX21_03250 [Chlorobium sp.]|nr:MAG: hypothetical protein FDX21_03250 [Chlorobium sp.]
MSSTKEWLFDQIEAKRSKRLADLLGITDDELEQISYEIDVDQSDDGLVYGRIVRFDGDNDPAIMSKIVGLNSGSYVSLSPWDLDDPEEDELEWEVENSEQLKTLNKHLSKVPQLLQVDVDENIQFSLLVMMHVHIVSVLEQFLSATFIHNVTNSDVLTRKLIETDPEFGCRKFTMNEIYAQYSNIKSTVAAYLKDIIFHDMRKVKPMYADVLGYDFGDIAWLFKAVCLRHDCAHRAGYDKEGNQVSVSVASVNELVAQCRHLSESIDAHVQKINNQ